MKHPPPSFLRGKLKIRPTKHHHAVLSNWVKTHAYIKKLRATTESLDTLLALMAMEYSRQRPRWDIFARLYMKYSRLRREVERAEIRLRAAVI